MRRLLPLLLLLVCACMRREVGGGEWTGVARPDAAAPQPTKEQNGGDLSKGVDAAPPDTAGAGAAYGPAEAGAPPRGSDPPPTFDPTAPQPDASADAVHDGGGDARACPDSGPCD